MRFYIKFFILGVCLVPIHGAFAGCSTYTSLPSGYSLDGIVSSLDTSCSTKKTVYMCETDTKLCRQYTYCTACSTSNYTTSKYYYSTCSVDNKFCVDCTYTSTKPSSGSLGATVGSSTGCSAKTTKYVTQNTSGTNTYFGYIDCTACNSGYFLTDSQLNTTTSYCPMTYRGCTQCSAGTYKSGTQCISCSAGTYSDTVNASSCTTCPSATDIWVDSSHSSVASVANGGITSKAGANSKSKCYLVAGKTYYNAMGAFTHPDLSACYQDGTSTVSGCSTVTYACGATNKGLATQAVQTGSNPSAGSGRYCFCITNGKYFYFTSMGFTDGDSTYCEQSCSSACSSAVQSNTTLRTNLGC